MRLALEQPTWLWLLALALPSIVLAAAWLGGMSPARRATVGLARLALLATLALALAGASSVRPIDEVTTVVLVDASDSARRAMPMLGGEPAGLGDRVRGFIARGSSQRRPEDRLGIVSFAASPVVVAPPGLGDPSDRELDVTPSDGTDLAAAIRLGGALLAGAPSGRLVVVSDGVETNGDALRAARDLAARARIPIDVVPLRYDLRPEVMVESIDVPPTSRDRTSIRVTLRTTDAIRGTLRVSLGSEGIDLSPGVAGDGLRLDLPAGRHVVAAVADLPPGRVHRFVATFEPEPGTDTLAGNNLAEGVTLTPGGGSILLVDGVSGADPSAPEAVLYRTLRGSGLNVRMTAPGDVPSDLLALSSHDLIILQNIPSDALTQDQQRAMAAFVKDLGGGLVMVGGTESFGAGGWKGSPLEPILPVRLDLPERLVQADAATVIVLDNSGSMGLRVMGSARTQQRIANEAAALAVRSLDRGDEVGVIAFSDSTRLVVPLGPNVDADGTAARIEAIAPGGGTTLGPALDLALTELGRSRAKVKHIVVLTDGRSDDTPELPARAEAIRALGIKLSTIAIGDRADLDTLRELARISEGTFYEVRNPNVLPRYFLRAVRVVRTPMVREVPFVPILTEPRSPLTLGLGAPPVLGGLTLTAAREEATVVNAMVTSAGEPVLAHWTVELGQAVAFTSDAHRWAAQWLEWPGYAAFWGQVARSASRAAASGRSEIEASFDASSMGLLLRALDADARPLDGLSPRVTVFSPDGRSVEAGLTQVGPGEYSGRADAPKPGAYVVIVRDDRDPRWSVVGAATRARGPEDRALSSDPALLGAIAEATGGRRLDLASPADLFDRAGLERGESRRWLWAALVGWSLVVLLADVATRRVAWDRLVDRASRREAAEAMAQAVRDRGHEAAGTLAALKRKPGGPASVPARLLGDEDADRVRREALRRRSEAMRAAARAAEQPSAGTPDPARADLHAAKRRAKERFEENDGRTP